MGANTQYQVLALDPYQGGVVKVFDGASFYELKYNRALNDVGVMAFTVPSTAENRNAFQLDTFIEVYRTDPNNSPAMLLEDTYLARLFQRYREDNEERFLVGGYSLNHLLKRRVVDPNEDVTAIDGYSRKTGPADLMIRDYVDQQMGVGASAARQFANFSVGAVASIGISLSAALRYDNLYDAMFSLAVSGQVDFEIHRSGGANTVLQVGQIGSDKSATTNYPIRPWMGLIPNRGNLQAPNFIIDRQNERTVMLALGQGQGLQRAEAVLTGRGYLDSPFNRWEITVDANSILKSDDIGLTAVGIGALYPYAPKRSFQCTMQDEGGNQYRVDWDLGDLITTIWDELQADLRVWGVGITVTRDGESITADIRTSQSSVI